MNLLGIEIVGCLAAMALLIACEDPQSTPSPSESSARVQTESRAAPRAPSSSVVAEPTVPTSAELRGCSTDADCTHRQRRIKSNGACCVSCAHAYSKSGAELLSAYCAVAPKKKCGGQPRCKGPPPVECDRGLCTLVR